MAEKKKKREAYYFSHDQNARHDENMVPLREKYGMEGYGLFWAIVETMRSSKGYVLSLDRIGSVAYDLHYDLAKLEAFVKDCIEQFKLFATDGKQYWSESLWDRMEEYHVKSLRLSNAGRKGADKRYGRDGELFEEDGAKVDAEEAVSADDKTEYEKIAEEWNAMAKRAGLAAVTLLTPKRKTAIRNRLSDKAFDYPRLLNMMEESHFCRGENPQGWRADFDFLFCSAHNYAKILEGKYVNRPAPVRPGGATPTVPTGRKFVDLSKQ